MPDSCLLDPALIAWDKEDFEARTSKYWDIPELFVEITDFLQARGSCIIMSEVIKDHLVDAFPAESISDAPLIFRDFISKVYHFLSSTPTVCREFLDSVAEDIAPDIADRPHFHADLSDQIRRALTSTKDFSEPFVASSHVLWPAATPSGELTFRSGDICAKILALLGRDDLQRYHARTARTYEPYSKHDARSGFGSRLPVSMTDAEMQRLLDLAVPSQNGGGGGLCAFSNLCGKYILFHVHGLGKYHGFPVEGPELEPKGFVKKEIPRL